MSLALYDDSTMWIEGIVLYFALVLGWDPKGQQFAREFAKVVQVDAGFDYCNRPVFGTTPALIVQSVVFSQRVLFPRR